MIASRSREIGIVLAFTALVAGLAAVTIPNVRVEANIAAMLPRAHAARLDFRATRALANSTNSRRVAFEVRARDAASARSAFDRIVALLEQRREVELVGNAAISREIATLAAAIGEHPEALGGPAAPLSPESIARRSERLRDLLASPFAADHLTAVRRDPLLDRFEAFDRLASLAPTARSRDGDGIVRSADGIGCLGTFFVRSGVDIDATITLLDRVEAAARRDHATIRWSGVAPLSARATQTIRSDVERISSISTVCVLALLGLAFARLRYVAIATLPLVAGTLAGLAAATLVYGTVHGIALAFAGAMLGVVIDYVEHFLSHRAMSKAGTTAAEVLREIRPSLLMAALTTFVGVSGFALSGIEGFGEITLVAGGGIAAGLLTTLTIVPALVGEHAGPTPLQLRIAHVSRRFVELVRGRRTGFVVVAATVVAIAVVALSRARFVDDPSTLAGVPPASLRDDADLRRSFGFDRSVTIVSEGRTCEAALEQASAVVARVRSRLSTSVVRTPSDFPGSAATQRARIAAVRSTDAGAIRAALAALDFDVDAFSPFFAWHSGRDASVVDAEALARRTPATLGSSIVASNEGCFVVSSVEAADEGAVRRAIGSDPASAVVVPRAVHAASYRTMVIGVVRAALLGLAAVILVCFLRYRDVRRTIAALTPAIASATTALGFASLLGPLDLMHALGALLVVSMGVDFGIFFVDSHESPEAVDATFSSVMLSALTTIFSFGALAFSHHRALASLGTTVAMGLTIAVALSPTALTFLGPRRASP